MEFSELKQQLDVFEKLRQKCIIDFVMSHCTVKIGDISRSDAHNIIVEKISVSMRYGKPMAVLFGSILKKDDTPRKDTKKGYIFLKSPLNDGESI